MAVAMVPESFRVVVQTAARERREQLVPALEAVEVFAGSGHLSEALVEHGMAVWKYEVLDTPIEDFFSDQDLQRN